MKFGLREAIFFLVLIAMPVAAFWFVFKPQNEEIAEARKEIRHKEMMLDKLSEATRLSADLERANSEISDRITTIESRLPSNKEVEVILEQVAEIARSSRLDLTRVKTSRPVPSSRYMEQPLEMTISGNFDNFYSFLLKVEQLDRITRMPDVQIKKIEAIDGSMEASFTLSIYFESTSRGAQG